MRRYIALLLTVALLFTFYGTALADTLRLPASLESIEREAFYGNTALDEVVVPYGTEYIKARAFADSSIKKIYIPETVTFIASNAFDGADDVEIHAPAGSYAEAFAEEYDYLWEDAGTVFEVEQMQVALDLLEKFSDDDPVETSTEEELEYVTLSSDGIDDTEMRELIAKHNALNLPVKNAIERFDSEIGDLTDECYNFSEAIEDISLEVNDNISSLRMGNYTFTIEEDVAEALGADTEVGSLYANENGDTLLAELTSNGRTYYLQADSKGISLSVSALPNGYKKAKSLKTFNAAANSIFEFIDYLNEKLSWIKVLSNTIGSSINGLVKDAKFSVDLSYDLMQTDLKVLKTCDPDSLLLEFYKNNYEKSATKYLKAKSNLRRVTGWKDFFDSINIPSTVIGLLSDIKRLVTLNDIKGHGHPTDYETVSAERLEIISKMVTNIGLGLGCYTARVVLGCKRLFGQVASLLSVISKGIPAFVVPSMTAAAVVTIIANIIIDAVLEYTFDWISEEQYKAVLSTDKLLHSIIEGTVIDADTKKPVKNVQVTCKGISTFTNSKGHYILSSYPGSTLVGFYKRGYNDIQKSYVVIESQNNKLDVEMSTKVTLTGTAVDATNAKPISGVTVVYGNYRTTTNASGQYSFTLKPGTATITFSKDGYITWSDTVTTELNKENTYNAYMSKKLSSGRYRVVLSWGSAPRDLDAHLMRVGENGYHVYYASKLAENASLDHDNIESESYGHFETITFLADSSHNYQYYIHDYTNSGNSSSLALARSGATVRVFCGDKMVGTYYVPNRAGTNWDVFTIYQGVFRVSTS